MHGCTPLRPRWRKRPLGRWGTRENPGRVLLAAGRPHDNHALPLPVSVYSARMNALLADLAREREQRSAGPSTSSPAPSSATKRSHDTIDLCDSDDEEPARSRCNQETADRALAIRLAREQEESASLDLAAELAQQFGGGGGGGGDGLVMMGFDPDRLRLSFARGSGRVRGTLADRARVGTCGFAQIAFYPREVKDKGKHEHYAERFGAVELDGLYYQVPAKASFEAWRRLADSKASRTYPPPSTGRSVSHVRAVSHWQGGPRRRVRGRAQVQRLLHAQEAAHRRRRLPRAVGGLHGQVRRARGQVPSAADAGVPHLLRRGRPAGGKGECSPALLALHRPQSLTRPPRRTHRQFNGTDTKAGLCFVRTP